MHVRMGLPGHVCWGSDSDIQSALKFPGKLCSATTGHEVRVRTAEQSKFIWRYGNLEWI